MIEYLVIFAEVGLRLISSFKEKFYGVLPIIFELLQNLENKRSTKIIGGYWGDWNYTGDTMQWSHCLPVSLLSSLKTKTIGIHQLAITLANHVGRDVIVISDSCKQSL